MTYRPWCFAALLLTLTACHFDGTSEFNQGNDETSDSLGGEPDPTLPEDTFPDGTETDLAKRHFASSEITHKGSVMNGSFRSLDSMDGSSEMLTGEVDTLVENLEQHWIFEDVPSGQHELTIVSQAYSPRELERFTISYRVEGQEEWTNVLLLRPGSVLGVNVNRVDVPTVGDVEMRAQLTPDAPALVEVVDAAGGSSFQLIELPAPEIEDGPDLEDATPVRTLRVDYLGLLQRDQLSN